MEWNPGAPGVGARAALQEASRERMEGGADARKEERLTLVAGPVRELESTMKNSLAQLTAAVMGPGATLMAMIAQAPKSR